MPREGDIDNSSAGMQSPEPATESSLSPEPISELKEVSEATSEESTCSKCGSSKIRGTKTSKPTCKCRPKLDEALKSENIPLKECAETSSGIQSPEPITESSLTPEPISDIRDISDALSDESICSNCGRSKSRRGKGIKPACTCTCRSKLDGDEEDVPLRDCAETDAAVKEAAQVQESEVGDHSLAMSSESSQTEDHLKRQPPAEGVLMQQEPTPGCMREICTCFINEDLELRWIRIAIVLLIVVIIAVVLGVMFALSVSSGPHQQSGLTMIRRTNFTAG